LGEDVRVPRPLRGQQLPDRVRNVLCDADGLATRLPGVVAIGLAGSWARGAGRSQSDVDLVVLLEEPDSVLDTTAWFSAFGDGVDLVRSADFGALQERRLRLRDALVVEVGLGRPEWARTDPVDPGTARVVRDGLVALYDPHGLLAALCEAVAPTVTDIDAGVAWYTDCSASWS
jgi:predicted nucleotidyltransferase